MMGILMKRSVRKDQEPIFSVFHELNLKDAMSYVAEVRIICRKYTAAVYFVKVDIKGNRHMIG